MRGRKLKKEVLYVGYAMLFLLLVAIIYTIETSVSKKVFEPETNDYDYVTRTIIDDEIPVVNINQVIIRPYLDSEIKVLKGFYDYQKEKETQERSLICHEDTYYQNSGVDYGGKENFEIVSVLDGEVITVKQDNLLGYIIEIKHSNEIISIYQSLNEVFIKENDQIQQGQLIGKTGVFSFGKKLGDRLHFELIYKGQTVDPEEYYEKELETGA